MSYENIKLSFFSGICVKNINFQEILSKLEDWYEQESFILETILDERNLKYPLRKEYQISFIKFIIQKLEASGINEIHDKFFECLAEKIKEDNADFSYKHFKIGSEYISVKESNSFIRDGTTGLKLWPAAVTLSNYIIQNSIQFNGKSILEIGSGCTGLVGLALLKSSCKPKQIFLSDCHDAVVNSLIENVNSNLHKYNVEHLESSLLIRQHLNINNSCEFGILNLPWEDIKDNQKELLEKCHIDTILAADIVYDSSIFRALLSCLNVLFQVYSSTELQFILSQTIRNHETFNDFYKLMKDDSFDITELSLDNLECTIPFLNEPLNDVKMFKITKMNCETGNLGFV